jgi:hypothetical protein
MIRKLQSADLSEAPLEQVQSDGTFVVGMAVRTWTGGSEYQTTKDRGYLLIQSDLEAILDEVQKVWPNIERSRTTKGRTASGTETQSLVKPLCGRFIGLIAAGIFLSIGTRRCHPGRRGLEVVGREGLHRSSFRLGHHVCVDEHCLVSPPFPAHPRLESDPRASPIRVGRVRYRCHDCAHESRPVQGTRQTMQE